MKQTFGGPVQKKALSIAAVLVALCGVALASFITNASAAKSHTTSSPSCTYLPNGQCTTTTSPSCTYKPYGECTTTTTSPTCTYEEYGECCTYTEYGECTTGGGKSPTAPEPGGTDFAKLTQAEAYLYLSYLPGVTVSHHGVVRILFVGSDLPVGIHLAPGVQIVKNSDGFVTINDHGVLFAVPYSAQMTVHPDGTIVITGTRFAGTVHVKTAHSTSSKSGVGQIVIPPKGYSTTRLTYTLPKGVSFGKLSRAQIASLFQVYSLGSVRAVTKAKSVVASKVSDKVVSLNKARTSVTLKLAKPTKYAEVVFSPSSLTYSKAVKSKSSVTAGLSTYITKAGKTLVDSTSFTFRP